MTHRISARLVLATLALALSMVAQVMGAAPAAPSPGAPVGSFANHGVNEAEVRDYWTTERITNAERLGPLEVPADSASSTRSSATVDAGQPISVNAAIRPTSAGRTTEALPRSLPLNIKRFSAAGAATEITDPSTVPFRTHGLVVGHFPGLGDFACSGTVIPSVNNNLVWTAGHCLIDERTHTWAENVAFIPGYREGQQPYGMWVGQNWGTSEEWATTANLKFDWGAVVLMPNQQGAEVAEVVGNRGITFSQPRAQTFQAFGYPAMPDPPFNGEKLYMCESPNGQTDPYNPDPGPDPLSIDCDMQQGASGGGWIIGFTDPATAQLNSNVSYGIPELIPNVVFGPYLGADASSFWQDASGGVPVFPERPVFHEVTVNLRLSKHLIGSGAVSVPDGFNDCKVGAPLAILRRTARGLVIATKITSSGARRPATGVSNQFGRYRMRLVDKPGRYRTYVLDGGFQQDIPDYCLEALSPLTAHRH